MRPSTEWSCPNRPNRGPKDTTDSARSARNAVCRAAAWTASRCSARPSAGSPATGAMSKKISTLSRSSGRERRSQPSSRARHASELPRQGALPATTPPLQRGTPAVSRWALTRSPSTANQASSPSAPAWISALSWSAASRLSPRPAEPRSR